MLSSFERGATSGAITAGNELKNRGNAHYKAGRYDDAIKEYQDGLTVLGSAGVQPSSEVLSLTTSLRSNRAASLLSLARAAAKITGRESEAEGFCREAMLDCSAVLDMPEEATPVQTVRAKFRRSSAVEILHCDLKRATKGERKAALRDAADVVAAEAATAGQKKAAEAVQSKIGFRKGGGSTSAPSSIQGSFLKLKDIKSVPELHVGKKGEPRQYIARSFMDKASPINMRDGSPKGLPPGVSSIEELTAMTPAQINRQYGKGAGSFFGEAIFWRKRKGTKLGKVKWESECWTSKK